MYDTNTKLADHGSKGKEHDAQSNSGSVMSDVATGIRDGAGSVRDAANDVAEQLPAMAAMTRDTMGQATDVMEASSSETLMAGATLSLGLALGLLIGGANRVLVVLALLPAAAMGATLLDRQARTGGAIQTRKPR